MAMLQPHNYLILLVEDDQYIRDDIAAALSDEGYQVQSASHGKEALQILQKGLCPHLILLDLMMPVMNGWEFLKEIKRREQYLNIPIVILSAFADKATIIGSEAISVLRKPIELDELLEIIREQCQNKWQQNQWPH